MRFIEPVTQYFTTLWCIFKHIAEAEYISTKALATFFSTNDIRTSIEYYKWLHFAQKETYLKRNNLVSVREDTQNWDRMWCCPVENTKQHSPDCQCLTGFLFPYIRTEDINTLVIGV